MTSTNGGGSVYYIDEPQRVEVEQTTINREKNNPKNLQGRQICVTLHYPKYNAMTTTNNSNPLSVRGIGNDLGRVISLDSRNKGLFLYPKYNNDQHQHRGQDGHEWR